MKIVVPQAQAMQSYKNPNVLGGVSAYGGPLLLVISAKSLLVKRSRGVANPISLAPSSSSSFNSTNWMASAGSTINGKTWNQLRHVESMSSLPSGAGKISHLNAVILGEALASEENDLVFPSEDFSNQALVPSPQKVSLCFPYILTSTFSYYFLIPW